MRRLRARFTLRSIMIVIAVAAIVFAICLPWWKQPQGLDPFDTLEMLGPATPGDSFK
jgi:hypothetical protein